VTLTADGNDRWRGVVTPRDDTYTLFLMVQQRPDGTLGAYLRNPDRNDGVFNEVTQVVRDGKAVRLMGHLRGQKTDQVLFEGSYDSEEDLISIAYPNRGGTYDFRRDGDNSAFYPRGKTRSTSLSRTARPRRWLDNRNTRAGADRSSRDREIRADAGRHADGLRAHAAGPRRAHCTSRQAGVRGVSSTASIATGCTTPAQQQRASLQR
jgi:hypothetical protein